jgi:hypothetical protein
MIPTKEELKKKAWAELFEIVRLEIYLKDPTAMMALEIIEDAFGCEDKLRCQL